MSPGGYGRLVDGRGVALLLGALQLALALPYLQTVPRFYNDEAWEASLGRTLAFEGALRHGFVGGWGGMDVHLVQDRIVLPFVCAGIFRIAGVGVVTSRLGAVLTSVLAVICTYGVMRRWFGARSALWIGLATVAHPWFFEISRRVRPEIYLVALAMGGLWCLLHATESGRWWSALLAGLLAGLAALAHPTGLVLVFAMACGVLIWTEHRRRLFAVRWSAIGFLAAVAPYGVYVLWAIQDPRVDFFVQNQGNKPLVSADVAALAAGELKRWSHFFQWPKGAPLAAVLLTGWVAGWHRSRGGDKSVATIVVVFAAILPITTVNTTSRYLVTIVPLLAALVVRLVERCVRQRLAPRQTWRGWRMAVGLGAAGVYTATAIGGIALMFHRLHDADVNRVLAQVASIVGPDKRVYGPPILWMGKTRYRYKFGPYPVAANQQVVFDAVCQQRFDYAVRPSWPLWSSHGIAKPPRSMPPFDHQRVIDRVCSQLGAKVAEFWAPGYGAFEVYRLDERHPPARR
jgi:hypothetical protein